MALVGEARIKVVADTKHIREEIQKAFGNMEKDADKAGNNVSKSFNKGMASGMGGGDAFKKFSKESREMSKEFHKAIRSSYKWQAASGILLQSLMALGGGLLALVGNIAGAASAGIALVGVMAQIKVASMVAKSAFKGIMAAVKKDSSSAKSAAKTIKELREEMQQLAFAAERAALSEEAASIKLEKAREALARVSNLPPDNRARREAQLAYSEAELAYRMAKDKNADLQDEILNPKKKKKAGDDPYKDLTKSQKEFALYLKDVLPIFKDLNEAAAGGFLPILRQQMDLMFRNGTFGDLAQGFADVSVGLGKATKNFAGTLFDPQNRNNLSAFFKNAGTTTGTLGTVLGKVFAGFLTLMRAINPLVTRFVSFLEMKSTNFSKNMQGDFANIQAFFKDAGDAAAQWGGILGKIFEKFKGMIKANVGPGTGGQLLLDFFSQGAAGFRGLDGAAGEFARKQHFLASATNLKAMLASIAQIFSFLSDIGTNPAVASFWNILAELEGPLSTIFENLQGSSDELASLLVTVVEIVASFADSGQLNAYMVALEGIFSILGGIAAAIAPVAERFGWLVGTLGALITTMAIFRKVSMLVWGTTAGLRAAVMGITKAYKIYRTAIILNTTAESFGSRVKAGFLLLLSKEGRMQAWNAIKTAFSASAKTVDAAATLAVGGASSIATPAVAGFSMAVNSAIWPLTLIVLAIAAVIAIIVIMIGHFNAVKADKIKKAGKDIQKSFKDTEGQVIGTTAAQDQWTASLQSLDGEANSSITYIGDLGKVLDETGKSFQVNGTTVVEHSEGYKQAKEAIGVYMTNLGKLAKKNLPEAQRQMRNFVVASGMSRKATTESIVENKELIKSLEKQAKAMGDTIMNADGTVNALKAVDYAIGEGSYIRQKAILEQKKFAETFKNAADTFIDSNDAMQKATTNGKLNLDKYVKEMKNQGKALTNWRKNISTLNNLFTDKNVLQGILAQGSAGAALVENLAEGGADAVKKYQDAQKEINKAKADADTFTKAFGDTAAVAAAVRKKYAGAKSFIREDMIDALNDSIGAGKGAFEIAAKFGLSDAEVVAQQRILDSGADLAKNVDISATWDKASLDKASEQLTSALGTVTLTTVGDRVKSANDKGGPGAVQPKDGGYITRAMGGLVARFADGFGPSYSGRVSGPGTARSDQIPAMISNGEFVVNARATASNLDLLNAINNNKGVGGAGNQIAITVNAAPGMDANQVAAQVARQLDAQLSRGGSL